MSESIEETRIATTGPLAPVEDADGVFPVIGMQYECIWVRDGKDRTEKISVAQLQERVRNRTLTALDHVSLDGSSWTRLGMTRTWREAFRE